MRKHDKTSRLGAMFLALAMVITMCLPGMAMAADADEKATGTITVKNLDEGASATVYKIVKAEYNKDNKVIGFKAVSEEIKGLFTTEDGVDFSKAPAANKAKDLAGYAEGLTPENAEQEIIEGTLTVKGLEPGLYYVKVASEGAVVYNPIIVGVNINDQNMATGGEVDAKTEWNDEAFAKKSEPTVNKEITTNAVKDNKKVSDTETVHEHEGTEDAQTIGFKISADVPSYSKAYTQAELILTDTLSDGLKLDTESIEVTCGGEKVEATIDKQTETGFKVTIDNIDWIRKHANQKVVVTYNAVLKADAPKNFDASTNTVTYDFTNDPKNKENHGQTTDKTYHYTFSLDGGINGAESWITKEIIKTGEEKIESDITENKPIKGAKFSLTNKTTGYTQEITTEENGLMNFTGLDGNTEYELVETEAPEGYFIDKTVRTIKVVPTYNENGRLTSYHVEITKDGEMKSSPEYTATYGDNDEITNIVVSGNKIDIITDKEKTDVEILDKTNVHEIKNSKQAELPSTGGMGTYIFTILGVAVIAIAGGLYMKKKNN